MQTKWLIIIILVIILMQTTIKKEGKFSSRCSEDRTSIELFNKNTGEFVVIEDCGEGECQMNGIPRCIQLEGIRKEAVDFKIPMLLIAGIIFILIRKRRN